MFPNIRRWRTIVLGMYVALFQHALAGDSWPLSQGIPGDSKGFRGIPKLYKLKGDALRLGKLTMQLRAPRDSSV